MKNYYITATIFVAIDDFNEGEGEVVNNWDTKSIIKGETPMEAVKTFFEKVLYFSFEEENAHIEHELNGVNVLQYSNYVNDDNCELAADGKEMAEFAQGKRTVFVATSYIEIFELVPASLLDLKIKKDLEKLRELAQSLIGAIDDHQEGVISSQDQIEPILKEITEKNY